MAFSNIDSAGLLDMLKELARPEDLYAKSILVFSGLPSFWPGSDEEEALDGLQVSDLVPLKKYYYEADEGEKVEVSYNGSISLGVVQCYYFVDVDGQIMHLLNAEDVANYISEIGRTTPVTGSNKPCAHEYVNISFSHVQMACKHCGRDQ